ncbi:MAG: winged helix DNA-binding domain-containing protein [Acidimicrobiales bacterium]
MSGLRRITVQERRNRLAVRHLLSAPGESPEEVADAMVVLHATDPATIYLSTVARLRCPSLEAVDTAMFVDRSMVRMLAMRRTLFVATRSLLPLIEQSSSVDVAAKERKVLVNALESAGVADGEGWVAEAEREILAALGEGGATARELTQLVPRLSSRIIVGSGKFIQETGATSRTLGVLGAEGTLIRGKPAGSWTGRIYTWHERSAWLGSEAPRPDPEIAATGLVERWLWTFGPATFNDLKWWTGWTVAKLRSALNPLELAEVDMDGMAGLVLAADAAAAVSVEPWVALLPSLDPTPMGWKERTWFLGDHAGSLFDRNGNIGPTIWVDGRIVGGWGQAASGEIRLGLLEGIGADHRDMLDERVQRLAGCLGGTVIRPSFPTPLQKELSTD